MIMGLIMIFIPYSKYMQMVYGGAGAILFSFYLVYDTQMMMGGDHKYSISPEEYVFAALALYLDIINLFLYILRWKPDRGTEQKGCPKERGLGPV